MRWWFFLFFNGECLLSSTTVGSFFRFLATPGYCKSFLGCCWPCLTGWVFVLRCLFEVFFRGLCHGQCHLFFWEVDRKHHLTHDDFHNTPFFRHVYTRGTFPWSTFQYPIGYQIIPLQNWPNLRIASCAWQGVSIFVIFCDTRISEVNLMIPNLRGSLAHIYIYKNQQIRGLRAMVFCILFCNILKTNDGASMDIFGFKDL